MNFFTDSAARPGQWRTITLMVSLCLNVGLVALLLVGATRVVVTRAGFIGQPGGALAPGQVMRSLTPERRQALRAVTAKHQDEMARLRLAARQTRAQTFRVFSADHYDNAAFAATLDKVSAADSALEEEAIAQTRDVAAALTPQERRAIIGRRRQQAQRPSLIKRMLNGN